MEIFYLLHDYNQSIEERRKTIEADPKFYPPYQFLGQSYVEKGMYEEAITAFEKSKVLSGGSTFSVGRLGHAYAMSGRTIEAQQVLEELKESANREYAVAWVYLGLGEKDLTFEWLLKSIQERASQVVYLNVDPIYDSLRSDPRFTELLRQVGLPV